MRIKNFLRKSVIIGALGVMPFLNNCGCERDGVVKNEMDSTDVDDTTSVVSSKANDWVISNVDFFNDKTHRWIDYAPTNFNPEILKFPSEESVRTDLQRLYSSNFDAIVTYGSDNILGEVPRIAKSVGIQHVVMGVWDLDSAEEWDNAIKAKDFVDGYCVGNEGLVNQRYTLDKLKQKMLALRTATGKPVTTTEEIGRYTGDLMKLGDWLFPNCHPYWHNITSPEEAAQWTHQQYHAILGKSDRVVLLKEIGLPSGGQTELNENVQNTYYRRIEDLMDSENKEAYIYFEAFDQPWKDYADVEPNWGLFKSDRSEKEVVKPQLLFTYVPPYGSFNSLQGRVVNVKPVDYRISAHIQVNGAWWVKPYWAWPLTSILSNSNWITDITTGGIDQNATRVNAYLVTPNYSPSTNGTLPKVDGVNVITFATAEKKITPTAIGEGY